MALKNDRRNRLWSALGLLLFVLGIAFLVASTLAQSNAIASPTDTATPTPTCSPSWQIVASPNTPNDDNRLSGMVALSPNDIWAVGIIGSGNGDSLPLMLHWQGTQWTNVPGPPTVRGWLKRVSAISTNDIWAVGNRAVKGTGNFTLAMHWDGTQWTDYPTPNLGPDSNGLYGIAAITTYDVWAAGNYFSPSDNVTHNQIMHWDGSEWSIVPVQKVGKEDNYIFAITALSTNDVWAAGSYDNDDKNSQPLMEHWDGTKWSVIPSPIVGLESTINAIAAVSPNDVWAAGAYRTDLDTSVHTLVLHWDGTQWSVVPSPNAGSGDNSLAELAPASANDVWAVGTYDTNTPAPQTLTLHWDGTQWNIVPSPNANGLANYLHAVTALPGSSAWTAGWYDTGSGLQTLVERYDCPQPTPTNTNTNTPTPLATNTYIPTTPTATTTPSTSLLIGHANWEARPPQPHQLQSIPITLTLKSNTTEQNYPNQLTDQYGFFTLTLNSLPSGTYAWRADNSTTNLHSPNYLANSGTVNVTGAPTTNVEIGLMRTGDANDNNTITITDFNILKVSFGSACGSPAYDNRADFTGDCIVNITDFNPLKANFGQSGAPPIHP